MEELDNVSQEERHTFRKLCEQIHKAFEGGRDTDEREGTLYLIKSIQTTTRPEKK